MSDFPESIQNCLSGGALKHMMKTVDRTQQVSQAFYEHFPQYRQTCRVIHCADTYLAIAVSDASQLFWLRDQEAAIIQKLKELNALPRLVNSLRWRL